MKYYESRVVENMLRVNFLLLFYLVQVAPPFSFSTVEDVTWDIIFPEVNDLGNGGDITEDDDIAEINVVKKISGNIALLR